ncbi:hypothetical protein DASC09_034980 [Saccharomycopsis crataegensis]|uniref:J domain-containing protein n=1 Tax=Saccharomycopsis crataegensis TaxID=43959 RepID=A0AAV5QN13_9ASCO|nr:hypothetical protein DASC09_034980 [Saccharomycopsis crataegensis]
MSDVEDIEKTLAKEEAELIKDKEIDRILNCFKLDAYSILSLQPGCSPQDIKRTYRKKSLLIHPDKTSNPRAPDAFDSLKKAQAVLADDQQRGQLDEIFSDARRVLIREKKWSIDDDRLKSDDFLKEWRAKTKELLIEEEFLKRMEIKQKLAKDGEVKRRREEALEIKERKRKRDKEWEDHRDERVNNWQHYLKKSEKKKKKKKDLLV